MIEQNVTNDFSVSVIYQSVYSQNVQNVDYVVTNFHRYSVLLDENLLWTLSDGNSYQLPPTASYTPSDYQQVHHTTNLQNVMPNAQHTS